MQIITPKGREIDVPEADDDVELWRLESHVNACYSWLGPDNPKTKKADEMYSKRFFELVDPHLPEDEK